MLSPPALAAINDDTLAVKLLIDLIGEIAAADPDRARGGRPLRSSGPAVTNQLLFSVVRVG